MSPRTTPGFEPTEEQLLIQAETAHCLVVEANAGAAKTTTLALVAAKAIERGIPPERILCLTYSEPACIALKTALTKVGLPYAQRARVRINTFEQYAASALYLLERHPVPRCETAEQLRDPVLKAISMVQGNPDERHPDRIEIPGSGDALIESFLRDMLHLKGTLLLAREAMDRAITPSLAEELGILYGTLKIFYRYESIRRGGHPDRPRFRSDGDGTYDLARLLMDEDDPTAARRLRDNLDVILVDEMHDMNWAMFTVLRHLLVQHPRAGFTGVGDRDQVIHALAGADAQFMGATFDAEIARAKRLPLTASYRFGKHLAKAAGLHAGKPYASNSDRKTEVKVSEFSARPDLLRAIVKASELREGLSKRSSRSEFAVLLRHSHQSIGLESLLLERKIPYNIVGFDSFLFRPEVLLVRGLLAYCEDDFSAIERPETRAAVAKALHVFGGGTLRSEGSGADDQAALLKDALNAVADSPRLLSFFFENQVLRNGSALAKERMKAAVCVARSAKGKDALEQVIVALNPALLASRVLVKSADVKQVADHMAGLVSAAQGIGEGMHDFFRALNAFELLRVTTKEKNCLLISSIEASKGLEFDHVVIPFMNQGEFADGGDSADARNLLYVAMTRARNQLTFMVDTPQRSQYLREMKLLDL